MFMAGSASDLFRSSVLPEALQEPVLGAGEPQDFQPVCDEIEHVNVTAGDSKNLIQPAWFLATTAVSKFPTTQFPGALLIDLKKQLDRAAAALELHLAFVTNKPDATRIDPFSFRDVCHLAQTVWFATGVLEPSIPDLAPLRASLAALSARMLEDFKRRKPDGGAGFPIFSTVFWGLAVGGLWYWWRRRKPLDY